jgi:hypothetical protein
MRVAAGGLIRRFWSRLAERFGRVLEYERKCAA